MCCAILYPQCVPYEFLRICRFFVSVFIFSAFAVRRTAFCFSVPYRFDRSGALLFLPETSAREKICGSIRGCTAALYRRAAGAFCPQQPWLSRRKKRIAGRPKQSEGRTAGAQPRRAGCKANAVTLYFLFIHPYFFASPQKGIKKSEKCSVFLPFFSLFMLVFYRFFILFYESASVKKPLISLHSGSSCVLWAGNSR